MSSRFEKAAALLVLFGFFLLPGAAGARSHPFQESGAVSAIKKAIRDGVATDDGTGRKVVTKFKELKAVEDKDKNTKLVTYTCSVTDAASGEARPDEERKATFRRLATTRGLKWFLAVGEDEVIPTE